MGQPRHDRCHERLVVRRRHREFPKQTVHGAVQSI
jgi:hypothetical protein